MRAPLYHKWLFLLGFAYYLILPIIIVLDKKWESYPAMDNLFIYYRDTYLLGYLSIVLLMLFFFFMGSNMPLLIKKRKKINIQTNQKETLARSKEIAIVSFPLFLLAQLVIFSNRSQLFQGYMFEDEERTFVGVIASACMFLLFMFLYTRHVDCSRKSYKFLLFALIELSVALISFGSRMYIMVTFFSILIYMLDNHKISLRKSIIWLSCVSILAMAFGILRKGSNEISFEALIFVGIMESAYTWISAISMYDLNELPIFAFPYDFLMSVVNFVPSTILPMKNEWLVPNLLKYENPLGATSLFYSLISNFGILGSFIALFFLGYYLTYVRCHWKTVFGKTYYYCLCGVIPFQLFRDPVVMVNKMFFFNFLILPLVVIKICQRMHKQTIIH